MTGLALALGCSGGGTVAATADSTAPTDAAPFVDDSGSIESGNEGSAPEPPPYPAGPYGIETGQVFPNVTLDGYREGKPPLTKISMRDYFDPDGSRGIHGFVLTYTAVGECSLCNDLGTTHQKVWSSPPDDFARRGARLLDLVAARFRSTGETHQPSRLEDVDGWIAKHSTTYDIGLYPVGKYGELPAPFDKGLRYPAYPTRFVIDPRTMKVVGMNIPSAETKSIPGLAAVLTKNGAPP